MANTCILKNARIIDVEQGGIFNGSIEIKEGRIEAVYREGQSVSFDGPTTDLEGKFVLPGLICTATF